VESGKECFVMEKVSRKRAASGNARYRPPVPLEVRLRAVKLYLEEGTAPEGFR
jgi:hypothetical protein